MKIMFVHGIGFHEEKAALLKWSAAWSSAITRSCEKAGVILEFVNPLGPDNLPGGNDDRGVLYYEELIKSHRNPNAGDYLAVVSSLLKSYVVTKIGDFFSRDRGLLIDDEKQWQAREVAAWADNDEMRDALRKRVVAEIREKNPDVVIAHSYGGLITYDACLFEDPNLLANRYYVTLGTQIGNPLLRREFGGRQLPVKAKHWFNLYNPGDPVFVAPLDHIRADNFTHLVIDHPNGHDGASYLGHPTTADRVWRAISLGQTWISRTRSIRVNDDNLVRPPEHRALLVGIDEYGSLEIPALKGCVNDTYLLSAALQESHIDPSAIKLLHNSRATRKNLLDHLAWLLDDIHPGDHRFFSFSGHGHRMASYDAKGKPDEMDEILVTYDYAFTQETGLRDRDFQDLYSELPKGSHFLIFLDCCHSGGITRSGGPLVRALSGPSDVEHACVKWDPDLQMWHQAGLAGSKGINSAFLPQNYADREKVNSQYYGKMGDLRRIGRATQLRDIASTKYDDLTARLRSLHPELKELSDGPYLPLVFMACQETEKACEYIHGSVSYGAFTFAMVQALRDSTRHGGKKLTYGKMLIKARNKLRTIGYPQQPDILAHQKQKDTEVPFGQYRPKVPKKLATPRASVKKKN